jgi:hypothetical protein
MSLKSFSNLYTESLLDTVMVSGLDTTITAAAGSIEGYATSGIELTSLTGSIDLFSTLSSVNASGLTEVNLNATSVNLDTFVFLAAGRSAGKTSATLPDVPASLLGIFAAAPDMPDITDSYPGGGYKTLDVPSQRFPSSGQTALGTAGAQPLTLANIGDRIQDIGNQFNRLIS